jgi:predicted RNA-binding Zn-ribbon protein involved in translation (DUF1610 family)
MNTYMEPSGAKITVEQEATPVKECLAEGRELFGRDIMKWKFRCPMCGHVASVQDFKDAGADNPNDSFQECIGRYRGAGSPGAPDGNPNGCNWAAYGLFGIPNNKGRLVMAEDGKVLEVFDFAREEAKA